jgi:hypothetical protein
MQVHVWLADNDDFLENKYKLHSSHICFIHLTLVAFISHMLHLFHNTSQITLLACMNPIILVYVLGVLWIHEFYFILRICRITDTFSRFLDVKLVVIHLLLYKIRSKTDLAVMLSFSFSKLRLSQSVTYCQVREPIIPFKATGLLIKHRKRNSLEDELLHSLTL